LFTVFKGASRIPDYMASNVRVIKQKNCEECGKLTWLDCPGPRFDPETPRIGLRNSVWLDRNAPCWLHVSNYHNFQLLVLFSMWNINSINELLCIIWTGPKQWMWIRRCFRSGVSPDMATSSNILSWLGIDPWSSRSCPVTLLVELSGIIMRVQIIYVVHFVWRRCANCWNYILSI
jgi:hypothetical protein